MINSTINNVVLLTTCDVGNMFKNYTFMDTSKVNVLPFCPLSFRCISVIINTNKKQIGLNIKPFLKMYCLIKRVTVSFYSINIYKILKRAIEFLWF